MVFTLTTHMRGTEAVIQLAGELDLASRDQVTDRVATLVSSGHPIVRADFSALTFMDSSGIASLLTCKRVCENAGILGDLAPVEHAALGVADPGRGRRLHGCGGNCAESPRQTALHQRLPQPLHTHRSQAEPRGRLDDDEAAGAVWVEHGGQSVPLRQPGGALRPTSPGRI